MTQLNTSYINGRGTTIEEQIANIFSAYKPKGLIIRIVFFGDPSNNEEYLTHLQLISRSVHQNFGDKPPVFSYVAQPSPKGNRLVAEVVETIPETGTQVHYKLSKDLPYISIESSKTKKLILGGVRADSLDLNIRNQSDQIFSRVEEILRFENLPIFSIIRQWNYIEQIVKKAEGRQNYQEFNDSRTRFYNKTTWENGFPAATGVGTSCGGVMIDLEALHSDDSDIYIVALNNSLQVPAHAYSSRVLIGKKDGHKTTPKFERAKLVRNEKNGIIYISGTAAIRGEISLKDVGIEEQTLITLENIGHLISNGTLDKAGIENIKNTRLSCLRIYLKEEVFFESAKKIVEGRYAGLPAVYLIGDVCREELLVEIEGIAALDI